jgi:hypothetical protein
MRPQQWRQERDHVADDRAVHPRAHRAGWQQAIGHRPARGEQAFKRIAGGGPDRVITYRRLIISSTKEVNPSEGLLATTIEKAVELRLTPDETIVTRHLSDGSYDVKRGSALTCSPGNRIRRTRHT